MSFVECGAGAEGTKSTVVSSTAVLVSRLLLQFSLFYGSFSLEDFNFSEGRSSKEERSSSKREESTEEGKKKRRWGGSGRSKEHSSKSISISTSTLKVQHSVATFCIYLHYWGVCVHVWIL